MIACDLGQKHPCPNPLSLHRLVDAVVILPWPRRRCVSVCHPNCLPLHWILLVVDYPPTRLSCHLIRMKALGHCGHIDHVSFGYVDHVGGLGLPINGDEARPFARDGVHLPQPFGILSPDVTLGCVGLFLVDFGFEADQGRFHGKVMDCGPIRPGWLDLESVLGPSLGARVPRFQRHLGGRRLRPDVEKKE